MVAPILSYCEMYPPMEWENIQELRSEDSQSELWTRATEEYMTMLTKAGNAFSSILDVHAKIVADGLTDDYDSFQYLTAENFKLDDCHPISDVIETWQERKEAALERSDLLERIFEEDEPEENTAFPAPLPVQPALVTVADNFSDSSSITPEPVQSAAPETTASTSSSTLATSLEPTTRSSQSITWAPLPDTTKPARKPSRSRRLRQSLGSLRRLVCWRSL